MKTFKPFILLLIILSSYSFAEIFKWTDENGVIHYSENKPEEIIAEEFVVKTYESVVIEKNNENEDLKGNEQNKKRERTRPQKVLMYSTQWCGVCKKAKKYLKKENIRYTNYDIDKSKSARAKYNKLDAKGVPVIFVGKRRMNGFSIAGFNQLYKQK